MQRRQFIKISGYSALAMAAGLGCSSKYFSEGNNNAKPNIVFLLTDDQRWDTMGCSGNHFINTPNLDALANDGIRFTNSFVTTPICCTSRASILTGQYAQRHGIHGFEADLSPKQFSNTYPAILRKAGYRTGFIGKYGVGVNMPESEFDVWNGIAGQPTYEHTDSDGNYKHLTSIMADQSIDFIKSSKKQQPFCLSISFKAPHVQDSDPRQFIYDKALEDMYKDVQIPLPETADDKFLKALPDFLQDERSEARKRWHRRFATAKQHQESLKGYYRLVTGLDIALGRIRKQLEAGGLADNTIIIFMSDNGFFLGEKGLAGKWYPMEESIRVPLLIYDPRLNNSRRGKTISQMALNIDIAPTILDMAGEKIPECMQGASLTALMKSKSTNWRDHFLIEHHFEYEPIVKNEAIRTEKWKFSRYLTKSQPYEQLHNIQEDPKEIYDLAKDEKYAPILKQLRSQLDELIKKSK